MPGGAFENHRVRSQARPTYVEFSRSAARASQLSAGKGGRANSKSGLPNCTTFPGDNVCSNPCSIGIDDIANHPRVFKTG
jgi:hypothetical protein